MMVLLLQLSDNNSCIVPSIKEQIDYLKRISNSPRQIALERIRTKGKFSRNCVHLLEIVVREWEADGTCVHLLQQTLNLLLHILHLDRTLEEELSLDGGHQIVTRLIHDAVPKLDSSTTSSTSSSLEEEQDAREDLRNAVFSIAYCFRRCSSNRNTFMFTTEDRIRRLPLVFDVGNASLNNHVSSTANIEQQILFHQVPRRQSSQADVGFVMWPSAVILAHYIVDNPHLVQNKTVIELGSGCGLTGLVAAVMGAKSVIQTDCNDIVLHNLRDNILLNAELLLPCDVSVAKLDFYLQQGHRDDASATGKWCSDEEDVARDPVSVVLAADVICKPSDSVAVSKSIHDCLLPGGNAYVICANAKHRFGVDSFEVESQRIGLEVVKTTALHNDNNALSMPLLSCCSGYVKDMEFLLFELTKPFYRRQGI